MFSAILLLVALQSPTVLQAIADGFPILGKLTRSEGMPADFQMSLIEVQLESDQGQIVHRSLASPNGEFRFNHVMVGRYWLVIDGQKFQNVRQRLEIDVRSFGAVNVNIVLYPLATVNRSAEEETVSVKSLLRNLPKDAQKAYDKALDEQRKGRSKQAISSLQKSIKLAPDFFEAHLQLGFSYQQSGENVEAMKSLERAVELNPETTSGRTQLGRLYYESSQYQKAALVLEEAIKNVGAPAQAFFYLGSSYYKLDTFGPAEKNLLHTLEVSPDYRAVHVQLCNLYMKMRMPLKALEQLETYLERYPAAPDHQNIRQQAEKIRNLIKL